MDCGRALFYLSYMGLVSVVVCSGCMWYIIYVVICGIYVSCSVIVWWDCGDVWSGSHSPLSKWRRKKGKAMQRKLFSILFVRTRKKAKEIII